MEIRIQTPSVLVGWFCPQMVTFYGSSLVHSSGAGAKGEPLEIEGAGRPGCVDRFCALLTGPWKGVIATHRITASSPDTDLPTVQGLRVNRGLVFRFPPTPLSTFQLLLVFSHTQGGET